MNGVALVYYTLTGRQVIEKEIFKASHFKDGQLDLKKFDGSVMMYETQNTVEENSILPIRKN